MTQPKPMDDVFGLRPGESLHDWCLRTFGPPVSGPEPTPKPTAPRLRRASAALERSIPPSHTWCRLDAPELAERVYGPAIDIGRIAYPEPRLCFLGTSRAGKTSLAIAMLRAWVATEHRAALFVPSHRLGATRIQHPAGHGEAPLVESAMRTPLVLLDDLGSERDLPTSAIPDVIFERHAQDLPTWMTTGLSRDALVTRYGAGVVARLFERARVILVGRNDGPFRKTT